MQGRDVLHQAEERIGADLEKVRQQKIVERMQFEKQIEEFNQKELLKVMHKKEMLNANKDYWSQQIKWNEARKVQSKVIDLNGGIQPTFLKKMFKYQEQLDIKKDESITENIPVHEVAASRQQRSRMYTNANDVNSEIKNQIEEAELKRKLEKMKDIEIGREMAERAEENVRQEYEFKQLKKNKERELMVKHWDEQVKLKQNEELVNRIFQ